MEWLSKMNDAINYIESNLEGKIDYREVARIACSSLTRFQRMFTFMTDISISDYVRFRKMSLAAEKLKNTGIKVVDLAAKYGYESPEAFTRAFLAFHGMPPTVVRKLGISKTYQQISFQISINGGNMMTGSKPLVRIEELNNLRAVFFQANCKNPETLVWNCMREWATKNLSDYEARKYIGYAPFGHHPEDSEEDVHEYVAMMLLHGEEGAEETMFGAKVANAPKGLFLVGDVVLNEFNNEGTLDIGESMKKSSQTIYECMLDMGNYDLNFDGRTYLEEHIFSKDWFLADHPEEIQAEYRFWLPIRQK
ncbi:helix-turn-helix domain-containing protein [Clostridium oryzae]|uniref:Multiple antibiotic resistance protein MarA n=1 Tax=Clostridium oryzae TaxID=1450648 RepID=A0A1V4IEB5_9CLOT|nr:AraC family transcriptional regulator [Clostridium oryzae]OPJ58348.1 multiple antibiotic resistance protein MarA [Clostridium oryzae]